MTIVKFQNGAGLELDTGAQPAPSVFSMTVYEGCTFWFVLVDELPSGVPVYREVSREVAQNVWKQEAE